LAPPGREGEAGTGLAEGPYTGAGPAEGAG